MTVIENYLTALSIIIVLKSFWSFVEPIPRKRKKGFKRMFNYMMTSFTSKEILILKLSLLWLIVFYFSYISIYANKILMTVGLEFLLF